MADASVRRRASEHARALLAAWVDFDETADRGLLHGISAQTLDEVLTDRKLAAELITILSALAALAVQMQSRELSVSPHKILQNLSLDIERRLGGG